MYENACICCKEYKYVQLYMFVVYVEIKENLYIQKLLQIELTIFVKIKIFPECYSSSVSKAIQINFLISSQTKNPAFSEATKCAII